MTIWKTKEPVPEAGSISADPDLWEKVSDGHEPNCACSLGHVQVDMCEQDR